MLWLAVAIGGSLGAVARYGIASAFYSYNYTFPYATLIANVLGCFFMGVCYIVIVEKGVVPPVTRHILMIGFLGAFTTFSTYALEMLHLIQGGYWQIGLSYAILSFVCSLFAVYGGAKLVEFFI